ncbi:MAG: neutral zinc metallopeptidase [Alcaligenaceae bacterium]|nr:neutral zinc metallopeptidase [Alcaligenaceae bacterium]
MKLGGRRQSRNVEDRRGQRAPAGRGGGGIPIFRGGKLSIGTIVIALIAWLAFGVNPLQFLGGMNSLDVQQSSVSQSGTTGQLTDAEGVFVAQVLGTTEDIWAEQFRLNDFGGYKEPRLVLYSGATRTACGLGQGAMGPFYCPTDQTIYLDLEFFRDTGKRMGVRGDFAQGYVIAHEVGHHVQRVLGILEQTQRAQQQSSQRQANQISVLTELQADCYAGIWAHELNKQGDTIDDKDIRDAMNAAAAVGDDRIQRNTQGYAVPDSFTHGSSEQRVRWFTRGLEMGSFQACNTFSG